MNKEYISGRYWKIAQFLVSGFIASTLVFLTDLLSNVAILYFFDGLSVFQRSTLAVIPAAGIVLLGWAAISKKYPKQKESDAVSEKYGLAYSFLVMFAGLFAWSASSFVSKIYIANYFDMEELGETIGLVYPLTAVVIFICAKWIFSLKTDR